MKNLTNTTETKTIVYFHTGIGGRFNNSGYKSFRGKKNIIDVLQMNDSNKNWNFISKENEHAIFKILSDRNLNNLIELFKKNRDANDFSDFEKKTGLILGEDVYSDGNGDQLITVAKAETGVGSIEWDGDYNTDTCVYLEDCSEYELNLIEKSDEYDRIDCLQEYFDKNTDLEIDWSKFNEDYKGLIYDYFNSNVEIEEFYEVEIED